MAGLAWKEFDGKSHQGLLLFGKRARGEKIVVRSIRVFFAVGTNKL
jgi:hypothetical protein